MLSRADIREFRPHGKYMVAGASLTRGKMKRGGLDRTDPTLGAKQERTGLRARACVRAFVRSFLHAFWTLTATLSVDWKRSGFVSSSSSSSSSPRL